MLNEQQQAVVAHGHGPALVLAGAGSGKTGVLVHRVAAMLRQGVAPEQILLITFTRRAAAELKTRVASVMGCPELLLPWCGTFHSVAARLLRSHGRHLGLEVGFTILDQTDAQALLGKIVSAAFGREARQQLPSKATLMRIHSYWRNSLLELGQVLAQRHPHHLAVQAELQVLFEQYAQRKRANRALDYDDLLHGWIELAECPQAGCAELFNWILVDEYQDTNPVQARILAALCRSHRNIMVVGDDAQAIYSFRGATVQNIRDFAAVFADTVTLPLQQNYRSTQTILAASNAVIAAASCGFAKHLFTSTGGEGQPPSLHACEDDYEQAETVLNNIMTLHNNGYELHDQAVLFRSGTHSIKLEVALQRQHLPFQKIGGQRFVDAAHIKDVMAFLRCRQNPHDETAWQRVLALLPGVGQVTAARWQRQLGGAAEPLTVLRQLHFPARAVPLRDAFLTVFACLFANEPPPLDQELAAVIDFYEPLLPLLFEDADDRRRELRELLSVAEHYQDQQRFLDDLSVGDDSIRGDTTDNNILTLSTIHSAKGCEWPVVHIIQLCDDSLPAMAAQVQDNDTELIEEERRLLYVAMTRARQQLHLYYPRMRYSNQHQGGGGSSQPLRRSRFLTAEVISCCELPHAQNCCDSDYIYEYDDYDPSEW